MMQLNRFLISTLAFPLVAGVTANSFAVPYASGVRIKEGTTWEFVLNEAADSVTVLRDGGNPFNIATPVAGRHTFEMAEFSTFEIEVSKNAAAGWTEISNSSNVFTNFVRPLGLAVNSDPANPYFGAVYVNNARSDIPSASGRTLGDGVYSLTGDLIGVELANNFAVVTDPNDSSKAFNSGWSVSESTNSAFRLGLDDAGNVLASDWSDAAGGIKYAMADLSSGGLVLAEEDGIVPLLTNTEGEEFHGSIVSRPYATGSIGNGLVLYGMDEDFDSDKETLISADTGNHVWKWNVGDVTNYDQPPDMVINVSNIPPVSDGQPNFLDLNVGVMADAHYEPRFDKWYLTQNRNDGTESGLIVVSADDVDGNSPTLDWSSKQFSIDNNLDGFTDNPAPGFEVTIGIQDIFRHMGPVAISPDGKSLIVNRYDQPSNDPFMDADSPLPGNILIIPLDAEGLPDIEIDDNGTPEDTTDDILSNVQSITMGADSVVHFGAQVDFDAAGNLYAISNAAELLRVFSPGGNTVATTTSTGTFTLETAGAGLPGDHNNDGSVDAADYVVWRKSDGNPPGYEEWRTNFGRTAAPGGGSLQAAAVPEPASWLLFLAGLMAPWAIFRRRRST
jgi:hypothetical protein